MAGNLTFNVDANDRASSEFAAVAAQLKELGRELDKIDGRNVKAKVTISAPGRAQIAQLDRAREALAEIDGKNARARVEITGTPTAAEVRQLRAAAKALRDLDGVNANARVDVVGNLPNATELRRAARALKDLQDVGDISIRIRITGDLEALAQLAAVRRAARDADSTSTVRVRADTNSAEAALLKFGKALLTLKGAAAVLGPTLLGSAVPALATLTGSLVSLAGLAPVAVGALASIGAVGVALGAGLAHVKDALGPRDTAAQLKKVNEAMAQLAPSARETVTQVRGLGAEWYKMRLDVQEKLFSGLGQTVQRVGSTYLPTLKTNLGGITTEFNGIAKGVAAFLITGRTVADVNTIFDNTRVAVHNSALATNNLLGAFRDIAVVGSEFLPAMATGWTNVTQRFQTFISNARESGQLKVWIQNGIDTLQTLGSIAGNVGSILGSVFTAAKASGADFLTTLDNVTARLAAMLASAQGQSALTAFFRESRTAIDAMMPGVEALTRGVLAMIQAFSQTGGLQNVGRAFSDILTAVEPLGAVLGKLAGDTLNALANGASAAAVALTPIVGAITGISSVLGPLPGLILACVIAFKALGSAAIAGSFATLASRLGALAPLIGTYTAGLTGSLAAGNAAQAGVTRLGTAVGKLGAALPLIGVGLIIAGTLYDQFAGKADEAASRVISGSQSMQAAIAQEAEQIHKNQIEWLGGMNAAESYAAAQANVTAEVDKAYAALSPMEKLQADVARSRATLNDEVARSGPTSAAATAAGAALAAAEERLKTAQDGAAKAAQTQEQAEAALASTMSSQIGTALAYSQAVERTAEAHKAADAALKSSGAQSAEYKGAVDALAGSMLSQIEAAQKQAEALGGTAAATQAYNTEILRVADVSTQAGRDAFAKLVDGLDDAGLAAITTAAEMSGLRTQIVTLPDGRKVTVVVEADRAKLDSVKAGVEELAAKKYIGTITMLGNTDLAQGAILETVRLADGTPATIKVNADGSPAILTVGQTKYTIDATTGTIKVLGDVAPGETSLAGLKVKVDTTTGLMTLDANPAPADAKTAGAKATMDTSIGTITIDGNPTLANGKTTQSVTFANGSKGTITIDGNQAPANGKITATVTYANGSKGTIQVDANDGAARSKVAGTVAWIASQHPSITVDVIYSGSSPAAVRAAGSGGLVMGAPGGSIQHFAGGGVLSGYAPGRDTELAMLAKGESVLVPELTRQLGAARIMAANKEASGGRPGTAVGSIAGMMDGSVRGGGGSAVASVTDIRRGASGGPSAAQTAAYSGMASMAAGVTQLRGDVQSLASEIRKQRPFVVEDRSGNPVETARATALALAIA